MGKGIPFGPYTESQSRRAIIRRSQSKVRCTTREYIGSTTVPRDIWRNIESFADDCMIYRKIVNNKDIEELQMDLNRLG
jgi:hypothetical protein